MAFTYFCLLFFMNFRTLNYRAMAEGYLSARALIASFSFTSDQDTFSLIRDALHLQETESHQFGFLGSLTEYDARLSVIDPSAFLKSRAHLPAYGIRAFLDQSHSHDAMLHLQVLPLPFLTRAHFMLQGMPVDTQQPFASLHFRQRLANQLKSSLLFTSDELGDMNLNLQGYREVQIYPKGNDPEEDALGFHHARFSSELEAATLERAVPPLQKDQTQAQPPKRHSL